MKANMVDRALLFAFLIYLLAVVTWQLFGFEVAVLALLSDIFAHK